MFRDPGYCCLQGPLGGRRAGRLPSGAVVPALVPLVPPCSLPRRASISSSAGGYWGTAARRPAGHGAYALVPVLCLVSSAPSVAVLTRHILGLSSPTCHDWAVGLVMVFVSTVPCQALFLHIWQRAASLLCADHVERWPPHFLARPHLKGVLELLLSPLLSRSSCWPFCVSCLSAGSIVLPLEGPQSDVRARCESWPASVSPIRFRTSSVLCSSPSRSIQLPRAALLETRGAHTALSLTCVGRLTRVVCPCSTAVKQDVYVQAGPLCINTCQGGRRKVLLT